MDSIILKEIVEKEKQLGLYEQRIFGFPFWRIVRFKVRTRYLKLMTGFVYNTTDKQLSIISLIKSFLESFIKYMQLFFIRNNHIENIIFAFPRLQKVGDYYMDKFTDPVILNSRIKENCLIFQKPLAGSHKLHRCNSDRIVKTDFIEVISKVLGVLFLPIVSFLFISTISITYRKARVYYRLNFKSLFYFGATLSFFVVSYIFHYFLLKKLKPKRVFLVNRGIFFPVILACKKQNIIVYEMQHGITHGNTALYSGEYDKTIDPDYFLSFGEAWGAPQFGIPIERIINIGWAYKNVINEIIDTERFSDNTILVISEPHISSKILNATTKIAEIYKDYIFHIRLHPQESLSEEQLEIIKGCENISIQSNSIESSIAIMSYKILLGENSSVLYEALSFGKKVGRLSFGGLEPEVVNGDFIDGFKYLRDISDFESFIKSSNIKSTNASLVYSDFNVETVNALL